MRKEMAGRSRARPPSIVRRAGDLLVNADVAMRAAWRGPLHAPVCHPETDATHRLTAIGARNFEQAPDCGGNHSRYHDCKNKSNDEDPWSGTHQGSGDDKKSDRATHGSV